MNSSKQNRRFTGINESKTLKNMYHVNVNVNLTVESVIQIKSGIMIYVNISVKTSHV